MSETLFDLAQHGIPATPVDPPIKMSQGQAMTARRKARIAGGLHPFGGRLLAPPGEKCGSCVHRTLRYTGDARHWKCELYRHRWTRGPGTDLRVSWPACERWEAEPGHKRRFTPLTPEDVSIATSPEAPLPNAAIALDAGR